MKKLTDAQLETLSRLFDGGEKLVARAMGDGFHWKDSPDQISSATVAGLMDRGLVEVLGGRYVHQEGRVMVTGAGMDYMRRERGELKLERQFRVGRSRSWRDKPYQIQQRYGDSGRWSMASPQTFDEVAHARVYFDAQRGKAWPKDAKLADEVEARK